MIPIVLGVKAHLEVTRGQTVKYLLTYYIKMSNLEGSHSRHVNTPY